MNSLRIIAIVIAFTFVNLASTKAQCSGGEAVPPPLPAGLDPNAIGTAIDYEALQLSGPNGGGPINEALQQSLTEISPIEEQAVAWYRQYPWMWIPWTGWTNSIEFGLNGSSGNSDTTSMQTGADLSRKTDLYTFAIDIDYQRTEAAGTETQNNGRLNADYDRLLGDTLWSAFGKFGLEYDEFKAFDARVNLNSGLGYYWLRNDTSNLVTRFGAGASREIGGPEDEWVPEAMFGYETSHQLTERQKIKGKIEYFPEWSNFDNFRLVSDVSWEILLDGVDNLSLKLAATNRYDSTPQGADPNDLFYSALLLWKF
jgi:putative salt-induced outer membrane protein YdiY